MVHRKSIVLVQIYCASKSAWQV